MNHIQREKVLMMNGGGIDSLALAILYHKSNIELYSLYIDWGYPNNIALSNAASSIANMYCASHKVIQVHGLIDGFFVPKYQHCMIVSIAISYAIRHGIQKIITGGNGTDNTSDFLTGFDIVIKANKHNKIPITVEWPLEGKYDPEQIYPLVKDSPLFYNTVSCLRNPVCGICHKCKRKNKLNQLKENERNESYII